MAEWSQDAKLKYGVPEFKSSRLITFFFFFFAVTGGTEFNSSAALAKSGNWSASRQLKFVNKFCPSAIFFSFFIQLESENPLCGEVRQLWLFNKLNELMDVPFLFCRCRRM